MAGEFNQFLATKVGKPALRGKGPEILEAFGATCLEEILNKYGPQEQAEIRQTLLKLDFKTYEATALLAALANEKDSIRLSLKHAAIPKVAWVAMWLWVVLLLCSGP